MNQFSEKAYINKIAIIGHASISAVLVLAYAAELAKKARTLGYYLFFVLLCLLPVILEYILYRRKKENPSIPIVMCVSYSIMYLFTPFHNTQHLCLYLYVPIIYGHHSVYGYAYVSWNLSGYVAWQHRIRCIPRHYSRL